jgi:glycosyltransferase involved in cell wall biosynthesis
MIRSKQLVSLCFAVYQNAGSLEELYLRSRKAMEENFPDLELEFVFVNDGSTDGSLEELRHIKAKHGDKRIKIVSFSRNFGQVAAVMGGFEHSSGDAAIALAADLQDPPEQCVAMVKEWLAGNEIVVSYRKTHESSWLKGATSRLAYRVLLPQSPEGGFDFVLLGRQALNALLSLKDRNRFFQHDILWIGFSLKFLPYEKRARKCGKSQWSHLKRWNYFLTGYLNSTYFPLRLFSFIGLLFAVAAVCYAAAIVFAFFKHSVPFEGWAPLMILLLLIGGLIMIMLGIIGEYLWRTFDEVKKRPTFIVKEIC